MTGDAPITITFKDRSGRTHPLIAAKGLSVMEVLQKADLVEGECGGSLACATCHVWVDPAQADWFDEPSEDEEDMLDVAFHIGPTSRLSCQLTVTEEINGLIISEPQAPTQGGPGPAESGSDG